jgi:hypothetical protein
MREVLSIDIVTREFKKLKIGKVVINYTNDVVNLFYDDCVSPMSLSVEGYEQLLDGHIVELHKGEVALVVEK